MQADRDQGVGRGSASAAQTKESDPRHDYVSVDITSLAEVTAATVGADVTIICAVSRAHPVLCFEVNCVGVYNACHAAVHAGHPRLVNTGPW